MRRNKVFQNGKSFTEARFNGDFYSSAVRIAHKTTHTAELFNLVDRTTRAGIRHHKNGVEFVESGLQFDGNVVRRFFPDGNYLFISFFVGYETFFIIVLVATIPAFLVTVFVPFVYPDHKDNTVDVK